MNKYYVSIEEFYNLLFTIKIKKNTYDGLICPLRGGAFIADYLSRKYNLPIYYCYPQSYGTENTRSEVVLKFAQSINKGKYLLVDDIYDSGETISIIRSNYYDADIDVYVLLSKKKLKNLESGIKYCKLVDKEEWVEFWYENLNKEK